MSTEMLSVIATEYPDARVIKQQAVKTGLVVLLHMRTEDAQSYLTTCIAPLNDVRGIAELDFMLPEQCGRDVNSPWGVFNYSEEEREIAEEDFLTLCNDLQALDA